MQAKEIADEQRKNYQALVAHISSVSTESLVVVQEYVKRNRKTIQESLPTGTTLEVEWLVVPKTIIFFDDGKYGILFDCECDKEHGLAVSLPDLQVGLQDILL